MWHMTHDTWHVTGDKWEEVNLLSKFLLLSSYGLGAPELDMWHLKCNTWHLTPDTWHLTPDTWHLTPDIWHVSGYPQGVVNIVSKFQLPSSYGLGVKEFWRHPNKTECALALLAALVYLQAVYKAGTRAGTRVLEVAGSQAV